MTSRPASQFYRPGTGPVIKRKKAKDDDEIQKRIDRIVRRAKRKARKSGEDVFRDKRRLFINHTLRSRKIG